LYEGGAGRKDMAEGAAELSRKEAKRAIGGGQRAMKRKMLEEAAMAFKTRRARYFG